MSGHSRWAQIKHKKAISDAKKGKVFSKMARLILVAAKEKGPDPEMNPKLRMAVEGARGAGMPKENIERAIERAARGGEAENLEEVMYEAYGPGGTALLIQGVTDNKNRTTNEIKHLLAEYGGKLALHGSVEWMFEKTGTVDIAEDKSDLPHDELVLALIDSGAKDVKEYPGGITAYVDPEALGSFKKALQNRKIFLGESRVDYVPKTPMILGAETRGLLERMLSLLDEHDDVQEIYTNANL